MNIESFMTGLLGMARVSPLVWAVCLGAALTLIGVLMLNWGATRRLKWQLRHEREEHALERNTQLRREVYLRAAQELVTANDHLLSISQLDPRVGPMQGLHAFFACSAQVQLIADAKTSQLMGQLAGVYGELALKAFTRARPIHDLNAAIDVRNGFYERSQAEVNRVLAAMARLNDTVQESGHHFMVLQKAFVHHQELASKYAGEREVLLEKRNLLRHNFVRDLLQDMKQISEAQYPVMVALRQELGLGGSLDEFRWQMEAQWSRLDAQLDAALEGWAPSHDAKTPPGAPPIDELSPAALVEAALHSRPGSHVEDRY